MKKNIYIMIAIIILASLTFGSYLYFQSNPDKFGSFDKKFIKNYQESKERNEKAKESIEKNPVDNLPDTEETIEKLSSTDANKSSIEDEPQVVETKKVEIVEYTADEIEKARNYVGSYNYITKEINKSILKCIAGYESVTDEVQETCKTESYKKFNMKSDEQSIDKLKKKYQEQLNIVQLAKGRYV